MPKMKTHSGAKKRFKVTGTGKVMHAQSGKRHGMIKRTAKFVRRNRTAVGFLLLLAAMFLPKILGRSQQAVTVCRHHGTPVRVRNPRSFAIRAMSVHLRAWACHAINRTNTGHSLASVARLPRTSRNPNGAGPPTHPPTLR